MTFHRIARFAAVAVGLLIALSFVAIDHAEARRGGSFGSRGARTFQSVPPTRTAPAPAAPVERSMTPNTGTSNSARQSQTGLQRPGFMSGLGGSLVRGLMIGGLIGLLMGHGFGGLAGMFGFLLQAVLIIGGVMLAVRFFRSRSARAPAPAIVGVGNAPAAGFAYDAGAGRNDRSFTMRDMGLGLGGSAQATSSKEIALTQADLDTFQHLLAEVQEAFGREDHAALRRFATPEMVSYLSEELADNAKNGLRNEVSDIELLQADIAESWHEDGCDYATAAMRYASRDFNRERTTGRIVDGGTGEPTETVELWTFVRKRDANWQLSAIQEARAS